jgi:hypothetical protein
MAQDDIKRLEGLIQKLQGDIKALDAEYYRNNFSGHQDFNKSSTFTTKLRVPRYPELPGVCETG